ncbi:YdbL family protein [Erythrobacter sp. sf7]|uniref:YdbL family protein n=1 Tax=Erythrobacter fulvus TaxID=2987523 RepID=A0ABT5JMZ3_9SPHN|nr:YdbL family protein [Erythrobacter fulvus]MDC8753565.1 YdbL family protein [Erythrobacter fulvus]
MRNAVFAGLVAVAAIGMAAAPALAQRDPAYAAARAAGKVGEKPDGYLGIVGNADPALQRLVDNINIKRKAIYSEKALENKATPEAYALTAGCQAIARTVPGEKYMAPDGSWQTRTGAPPIRDPRCP